MNPRSLQALQQMLSICLVTSIGIECMHMHMIQKIAKASVLNAEQSMMFNMLVVYRRNMAKSNDPISGSGINIK